MTMVARSYSYALLGSQKLEWRENERQKPQLISYCMLSTHTRIQRWIINITSCELENVPEHCQFDYT